MISDLQTLWEEADTDPRAAREFEEGVSEIWPQLYALYCAVGCLIANPTTRTGAGLQSSYEALQKASEKVRAA